MILSPLRSPICLSRGVPSVSVRPEAADADSPADESGEVVGTHECQNGTFEEGQDYEGGYDEGYEGQDGCDQGYEEGLAGSLGPNQMVLTLSLTLVNQIRQVARIEGVSAEDFVHELVAEGVTRRAFEDANRNPPSHLMTHTGYVASDAHGYQAPKLSHHYNQNRSQGGGNQRRFNNNQNRGGNYNNNGNNGNSVNNGNGGNYNNGNRYNNNGNQKNRFNKK